MDSLLIQCKKVIEMKVLYDKSDENAVVSLLMEDFLGIVEGSKCFDIYAVQGEQRHLISKLMMKMKDSAKNYTGIIIRISGSKTLSIKACKNVVENIAAVTVPETKIIWGASAREDIGEKVQVFVIGFY